MSAQQQASFVGFYFDKMGDRPSVLVAFIRLIIFTNSSPDSVLGMILNCPQGSTGEVVIGTYRTVPASGVPLLVATKGWNHPVDLAEI